MLHVSEPNKEFNKEGKIFISVIFSMLIIIPLYYFFSVPLAHFSDSKIYIAISKISFFSPFFWFSDSPVVFPTLIKLLGNHVNALGLVQTLINITAISYFTYNARRLLTQPLITKFLLLLLTVFLLSPLVQSWNQIILTGSITNSMLFFTLGSAIAFLETKKKFYFLLLITTAIIFIFSRDFNGVISLFLLPAYCLAMLKKNINYKAVLLLIATILFAFFADMHTLKHGDGTRESYRITFGNVIVARMVKQKNKSLLTYLGKHRFPYTDLSKVNFNRNHYIVSSDVISIPEIKQWINKLGHKYYYRYLIQHPYYTFIMPFSRKAIVNEGYTDASIPVLLYYNIPHLNYLHSKNQLTQWVMEKYITVLTLFLPCLIGLSFLFIGIKWIMCISASNYKPLMFLISNRCLYLYYLILSSLILIVFTWHGDTLETDRHMVAPVILLYLSVILLTSFIAESMYQRTL